MGAWGASSFENDEALDWLGDFCDEPDQELIVDALTLIIDMEAGEYLDASDCCISIAAAEVVAGLKGAPNPLMPAEFKECLSNLQFSSDINLISLSLCALERIKTESELKELWDESDAPNEWYEAIDDLEDRLK